MSHHETSAYQYGKVDSVQRQTLPDRTRQMTWALERPRQFVILWSNELKGVCFPAVPKPCTQTLWGWSLHFGNATVQNQIWMIGLRTSALLSSWIYLHICLCYPHPKGEKAVFIHCFEMCNLGRTVESVRYPLCWHLQILENNLMSHEPERLG